MRINWYQSWRAAHLRRDLRCLLAAALLLSGPAYVQAGPRNLAIWPGSAPAGEAEEASTLRGQSFVRNVVRASVDAYLPEPSRANGGALVVCPGGAFRFLNIGEEGSRIAQWLNGKGYAAFVLHYRLKPTPRSDLLFVLNMLFELPPLLSGKAIMDRDSFLAYADPAIADGRQALRFVRDHAQAWRIDPKRIGMVGFSAGGVVALGASVGGDPAARPDFSAAIYSGPVELGRVPPDAPPLYLAAADDDPLTALATRPVAAAWNAARAPVELRIYQHGGHGFKSGTDSDRWMDEFGVWLDARNH